MVKNTAPPPGPKKDVRPPSFAAIFARQPARGSAPPLRRPQNRFRPAFAYCEQAPTIQLSLENSIPALIRLTQVFSQLWKHMMRCHFLAVCGTAGLLLAATGVPLQAYEFQQIFGLPLAGMDGRPRAIAPPRELVAYKGRYAPGTIVISTEERRLYYVLPGNLAVKYGIGAAPPRFRMERRQEGCDEARMAVLDAALKDAAPPSGSAAFPARRTGQSARRAGHVYWRYVFSHPRLE